MDQGKSLLSDKTKNMFPQLRKDIENMSFKQELVEDKRNLKQKPVHLRLDLHLIRKDKIYQLILLEK